MNWVFFFCSWNGRDRLSDAIYFAEYLQRFRGSLELAGRHRPALRLPHQHDGFIHSFHFNYFHLQNGIVIRLNLIVNDRYTPINQRFGERRCRL